MGKLLFCRSPAAVSCLVLTILQQHRFCISCACMWGLRSLAVSCSRKRRENKLFLEKWGRYSHGSFSRAILKFIFLNYRKHDLLSLAPFSNSDPSFRGLSSRTHLSSLLGWRPIYYTHTVYVVQVSKPLFCCSERPPPIFPSSLSSLHFVSTLLMLAQARK